MESDKKIFTVGVVPEHFSLPFQLAKGKGIWSKHQLEVITIEHPRGTGSMCRALRTGELDVAVALTEGVITDIVTNGPGIKILATYVASPLHWAIVVNPELYQQGLYKNGVADLKGKTFGISRFGSGSHLMTYLLADQNHWNPTTDLKFKPLGGLNDLLQGIKTNQAEAFLWETFTTKPSCDEGLVKKIGEVVTPWSCFVIAIRSELLENPNHRESIKRFLTAIQEASLEFKKTEKSLKYISKESKLSTEDSKKWFDQVEFSYDGKVPLKMLKDVLEILTKTGIIKNPAAVQLTDLYDSHLTKVQ